MTEVDFLSPNSALDTSGDEAPQDPTKVRRSKDGRPYVKVPCPDAYPVGSCASCGEPATTRIILDSTETFACLRHFNVWKTPEKCVNGRLPGKRPGTTKACPTCKGKGDQREVLYSRCTSFVDVMESRNQLEAWKRRVDFIGLHEDPTISERLWDTSPDDRAALDALVEEAFEAGDGYVKSQKGTDLHALSEDVDRGLILGTSLFREDGTEPPEVTLQDRADMAAYRRTMEVHGIEVLDIECFVVNDRFRIGGTFDRRVAIGAWPKDRFCQECNGAPYVLDLKTGRVDFGAGKMAQQLAVYANSENYDPLTGKRSPLDVCPHVGLILHLPQGTGTASLLTVDLVAGYEAVALSDRVRNYRNVSKKWMEPVPSDDPISFTINP